MSTEVCGFCSEIHDNICVMIGYGFPTFWKLRVKRIKDSVLLGGVVKS